MSTKNKKDHIVMRRAKDAISKIAGHISFADVIKSTRLTLELTQVEMANKLGISKQDLCNIEKGRKFVSVERAIKFASIIGQSQRVFAKYVIQDQIVKAGLNVSIEIKEVA